MTIDNNVLFGAVATVAGLAAWYRRLHHAPATQEGTTTPSSVKNRGRIKTACVFCGSRAPPGILGVLVTREARELAKLMVAHGVNLVYGGGSRGVMGMIASSVDHAGGKVTGIIPEALKPKEASGVAIQPQNVKVVQTMHQRKTMMAEMSDVFIALPGGFGTFEEVLEMITWTQLGIHRKTVALLNVGGFYDKLLEFFNHAVSCGFITREKLDGIVVHANNAQELFDIVYRHTAPEGYLKWNLASA